MTHFWHIKPSFFLIHVLMFKLTFSLYHKEQLTLYSYVCLFCSAPVPMAEIERMAALCMKDIDDDDMGDDDLDDEDLLVMDTNRHKRKRFRD